jgi:hypothetical protein
MWLPQDVSITFSPWGRLCRAGESSMTLCSVWWLGFESGEQWINSRMKMEKSGSGGHFDWNVARCCLKCFSSECCTCWNGLGSIPWSLVSFVQHTVFMTFVTLIGTINNVIYLFYSWLLTSCLVVLNSSRVQAYHSYAWFEAWSCSSCIVLYLSIYTCKHDIQISRTISTDLCFSCNKKGHHLP